MTRLIPSRTKNIVSFVLFVPFVFLIITPVYLSKNAVRGEEAEASKVDVLPPNPAS